MQIPSCVPVVDSSLSDIVKEVLEEQVRPSWCCFYSLVLSWRMLMEMGGQLSCLQKSKFM